MRASFFCVVMVGVAALSLGCSTEETPAGAGRSDVTEKPSEESAPREEWSCTLNDARIVQVYPTYSEIHRLDPKWGTWSMQDGLTIETSPWVVKISDDEGGPVATIDSRGSYYAEEDGQPVTGTCKRSLVEKLEPSSAPFALDETLEYACEADGAVDIVVRPKVGEVDAIHVNDGRYYATTAVSFEMKTLESSPPKIELTGRDKDGLVVATIIESASGISITKSEIRGSCEKVQRSTY